MHMNMELLSVVETELHEESFHDSSAIPLIIQRSMMAIYVATPSYIRFFTRILLANIKFLGQCPCPRCLVKKVDVPKMGTKPDMHNREVTVRVDDNARQWSIKRARQLIFQMGARINGKRIRNILDPQSLVPTRVSFKFLYYVSHVLTIFFRTLFRISSLSFSSTFSCYLSWTCCMSSNLASGRQYSPI
jgi:hypothetical protein